MCLCCPNAAHACVHCSHAGHVPAPSRMDNAGSHIETTVFKCAVAGLPESSSRDISSCAIARHSATPFRSHPGDPPTSGSSPAYRYPTSGTPAFYRTWIACCDETMRQFENCQFVPPQFSYKRLNRRLLCRWSWGSHAFPQAWYSRYVRHRSQTLTASSV